jgi:hypothetical protein
MMPREPTTTEAAAAIAGTREQAGAEPATAAERQTGEGKTYRIGPGVERGVRGRPYERTPEDPLYRPLKIFVLDPAASRLEGSMAIVNVPYEPLESGFRGRLFEVDCHDGGNGRSYRSLNLDDRKVLLNDGRTPSPADPLFHQQMVYTVATLVYATFKKGLGRHPAWGFTRTGGDRLRLRPYALLGENAFYDREAGEICFGYYQASVGATGRNLPQGLVFTSLSHDIVVHEITHALLDGLRSHFCFPSGPDVLGFHEGFADLLAILQRFSYRTVVEEAMRKCRGEMSEARILTDLARQFGQTVEGRHALRSAIDTTKKIYDPSLEAHALGSVLVSAVFDAMVTVFKRRVARFLRLATGGTAVLPPGEIHPDLRSALAEEASKVASQFLSICIRAIDYCPPVDLELGEFLRAVVTADRDLVPDDRWGYREAWIDAFGSRRIFPPHVRFLTEDALLWEAPRAVIGTIADLTFAALRFEGDPACPASAAELRRQAGALGRVVTRPVCLELFGLGANGDPRLGGDRVELPQIQSIRSSRRIGPQGQVVFDLVAEVTQVRQVRGGAGLSFDFLGGSTIIIGPRGEIRYSISKSIFNEERLARQREFMAGPGRNLWKRKGGCLVPVSQPFRLLHERWKSVPTS